MTFGPIVKANPNEQQVVANPARWSPAQSLSPEVQGAEPGLLHYWHILLKRKWTVLTVLAVITIMAAIGSLRTVPLYDSVGKIAINRESNDMLGFKNMESSVSMDDYDYTVMIDTQVKILESQSLAAQVVRKLRDDRNAVFNAMYPLAQSATGIQQTSDSEDRVVSEVLATMRVTAVPGTRIVEIRSTTPSPRLSAELANAYINTYIEQNFKTKYEQTMQTSDWLQRQLADLRAKVETSQEKLVRYQKENGILGVDEKQNIITAKLDEINKELTTAEGLRMQKESEYKMAQANQAYVGGPGSSAERLRNQALDLKTQLAQMSTSFGPSYPKVVELRNQLKQVEAAIETENEREISKLNSDYRAALQRESLLRSAFEQQKQEANRLNERSIDYNILKRDLDTNRELYEGLLQRLKEASVTASLRSSNVRVVDLGHASNHPSKPNIPRNIFLAFIVGSVAGVGLAFLVEAADNTLRTPDQVQSTTGLPSLGLIPLHSTPMEKKKLARTGISTALQAGRTRDLLTPQTMKSEIAEAYRSIRTAIMLSGLGTPPQCILFTSPMPQEGKSTTSANSAIVMAQQGKRVLLLDGDMRRPSIARKFRITANQRGLSSILAGNHTLDDCLVQAPEVPNLWILPSGPVPPHPAELISSPRLRELIAQCRSEFDHIIVDSPPLLSVTDSVLLSIGVDGVVLVVRSGRTTKQALRRSRELLVPANARIIGVVVNGFDIKTAEYAYYYQSYGYGGTYYTRESSKSVSGEKGA